MLFHVQIKNKQRRKGFKLKILLDRKIFFILEQLHHSDNVFRLVKDIKSFTSGKGLNFTLSNIHQKPAADDIDNVEVKKGKPKFN